MTDHIDSAQELEQRLRDDALAAFKRGSSAARDRAGDGGGLCVDCHDEISADRLAAAPGAVRCTPCQAASERRR